MASVLLDCDRDSKNTMTKVVTLLNVFIINCHVLENCMMGPQTSQVIVSSSASMKAQEVLAQRAQA
jgi:hypothetical protein